MLTAHRRCYEASGCWTILSAHHLLRLRLMFPILMRRRSEQHPRCANNWNYTEKTQPALHVMYAWILWDSAWKTSTPSGPGARRMESFRSMLRVHCLTEDHSLVHVG